MEQLHLRQIVAEARAELARILGDRLHSVVLYGSQARGEATDGSDIDLVVVVRGEFDYGDLIEQTSPMIGALSLKYDVVLSRVFISQSRFEEEASPFVLNVRREGIPV